MPENVNLLISRDLDQEKITYNGILPDLSGMFEGPVEKQIRETGEWFAKNSEERLRSSSIDLLLFLPFGLRVQVMINTNFFFCFSQCSLIVDLDDFQNIDARVGV